MAWNPQPFEDYRVHFPRTPTLHLPDPAPTQAFLTHWALGEPDLAAPLQAALHGAHTLFVRGYLGSWMPGNLAAPAQALTALGLQASVSPQRAGAKMAHNIALLAHHVDQAAPTGPLLFCGHSRGGLEILQLLAERPDLAARTLGVILSQTPRGPSAVLDSLLTGRHHDSYPGLYRRLAEQTQRTGLHAIGAAPGGRQLCSDELPKIIDAIDRAQLDLPIWQTATWSTVGTTWLDAFHERLGEIRPGVAHDGQFWLEDQLWPGLPHVLLPEVDHAQPVVGGLGFPHARYWATLIACFLRFRKNFSG